MDLYDIAVARKLSSGGGGSSDFSEAKITINFNLPEGETVTSTDFTLGFYYKDERAPFTGPYLVDENIASVPMYKGQGLIQQIQVNYSSGHFTPSPEAVTASGGIVWNPNVGWYGSWLVTGDGSLTITIPPNDDEE